MVTNSLIWAKKRGDLQKNGQNYCSEACANNHPDGAGCGHEGCECNS
ncbi:hypothetical protein [Dapis sp. BLCC M172]